MNERIKQFALEAKAQYCELGDASCFKRLGLVESVVFTPEDLEKFAELIVRECALVVHKKTGPKSALNVLEHFGVEE